MTPRIWLLCGRGGVGKTTVSAALAWALASSGRSVALMTIDPARRLADALGLELGNSWSRVHHPGTGTLDAAMLDRAAAWDELVRRELGHAAAPLLEHPVARAVATRLGGAHEYLALERLERTAADGRWTDVVVDTPPARHAVDLLRGPARLGRAFDPAVHRGLRAGGGVTRWGARALGRVAGSAFWDDIAGFFDLAQALGPVLRARSELAARRLRSEATRAWWVARADEDDLAGLDGFRTALRGLGVPTAGVIANRCIERPAARTVTVADPPSPDPSWTPWCVAVRGVLDAEVRRADVQAGAVRRLQAVSGLPVLTLPDVEIAGTEGISALAHALGSRLPA